MKLKKIIILLFVSLCLNSCFIGKSVTKSKATKEFTIEHYAIPPEFGKDKNVVLIGVLKGTKSYMKFLKKNFEKVYHGEYLLITEDELNSVKYNDLNKYRYMFSYGNGTTYTSNITSTTKKYFVYDRLKKKKYITGAEYSYYAKAMEAYLTNLEKIRIKQ